MHAISRRRFLAGTSAAAITLGNVTALTAADAPSAPATPKKLRLGIIGCGGYGMVNAKAALKVGGVVVNALCDADSDHLAKCADEIQKLQGTRPQVFKLYQELLAMPELDAVVIATPPHWHALQFLSALERGVDVYLEKPLAYDVREGQVMRDAAARSKNIVQVGFQRRQSAAIQAVQQHIQAGNAGRIVCVDANIHYTAGVVDCTLQSPPTALDWELWCGPAPKIPYSPQVGHVHWRLERTTGHGHLVDWGIHLIDAARFILKEGMPVSVSAAGGLYELRGKITTPDVLTAHFEFPGCPVIWRHRIWGAQEYAPKVSNGLFFYGEKETIFVTDDRWEVIPRGKEDERKVHEVSTDMGLAHMKEFLEAVRSRNAPGCSVDEAYRSTTCVKLAMIAYDTGGRVSWDTGEEQIVGDPRSASLLKREYRSPWKHPCKV
jgi:predicted dehydrogenase